MALPKISVNALAALEEAGVPASSVVASGATSGFPSTTTYNAYGELWTFDQIFIWGVILPLAETPKTSLKLKIDKKKAPGSDYETYTSKGLEQEPVEIKLLLWRDRNVDWFAEWAKIAPKIPERKLDRRNGVTVYHPVLAEIGVTSVVFTGRTTLVRERGQIYSVTLTGYDPKRIRQGTGKKAVQDKELASRQGKASGQFADTTTRNAYPPGKNFTSAPDYPGPVVRQSRGAGGYPPPSSVAEPANPPLQSRLPPIYQSR